MENSPTPPNIFIVDDDLITQFVMRIKIQQTEIPCKVTCFDNTHDIIGHLIDLNGKGNKFPNIIFLDLSAPNMNGWELLEQVRNLLNEQSYPDIYLLSNYKNTADILRAKDHPLIKGLFVKPISIENLAKAILMVKEKEC